MVKYGLGNTLEFAVRRLDCRFFCFGRPLDLWRQIGPESELTRHPILHRVGANVSSFRINTCKSVTKQTTLTIFRINTYEKQGGG